RSWLAHAPARAGEARCCGRAQAGRPLRSRGRPGLCSGSEAQAEGSVVVRRPDPALCADVPARLRYHEGSVGTTLGVRSRGAAGGWASGAGGALGVFLLIAGALWWRLSSGPISLDIITPWLTAAISENVGNQFRIEVGGTVLERDEHGRAAMRIRDIKVRDRD